MKRQNLKQKAIGIISTVFFALFLYSGSIAGAAGKPFKGQSITATCWSSEFCEALAPVIADFEKKTGGKVNLVPAWGGFYAKIKVAPENQPPWDVIMVDPMEYPVLRKANFLLPIKENKIPNIKNIFPAIRKMSFMDGYGIVVGGEPTIPMYNKKQTSFTPTGWVDFLKPELKGSISISKDYWVETLYQAAYILDQEEGAGEIYSDIDAVYKKASEIARHSKLAYSSGDQIRSLVINGEVSMAPYYGCTVAMGQRKGLYKGFLPKEGYTGYVSILSVVRGTPHQELAEAWINEFLTEKAQAGMVESGGGCTVNIYQKEPAWIHEKAFKEMMLTSNESWEKLSFPDYAFFRKNWEKYEERYNKEVLSQIGKK